MKILHLINGQNQDGHTKRTINECINLNNFYNIELYCISDNFKKIAIENNIKLKNDDNFKDYSILHCHCKDSLNLALSKKANKQKIVFGLHFNKNYSFLIISESIDKVVCVSKYDRDTWRKLNHHSREKIITIPTCINTLDIDKKINELDYKEKYNIKKPIIGMVANNIKRKNYDLFIELSNEFKDYQFVAVGEKTAPLNKYDNIIGLSYKKDIYNIVRMFDIYIQTSKAESLGTSILEAGYLKKPIIASNVDGIPEIIDHNFNGFLASSKEDYIKYIKLLSENKYLANELSERIHNKIKKTYNINIMIDGLRELYEELLK